jgi:hypothetical protein
VTLTDEQPSNPAQRLGRDRYDDAADYIDALQAAIRTHRQLGGGDPLDVEIDPEGELGLVQRAMLR